MVWKKEFDIKNHKIRFGKKITILVVKNLGFWQFSPPCYEPLLSPRYGAELPINVNNFQFCWGKYDNEQYQYYLDNKRTVCYAAKYHKNEAGDDGYKEKQEDLLRKYTIIDYNKRIFIHAFVG